MKGAVIPSTSAIKTVHPDTTKPKSTFLNYIHNFRGLAILFVVGGHILLNWESNSIVKGALDSVWQNGTVLFVFIAGYLFQYLSSKYETTDYWFKKFRYVLIPYFIISIPAIILRIYEPLHDVLTVYPDFEDWSLGLKVGFYYITGAHLLPLWFVPMITLFYAIAPILIRVDRSPKAYYILPLLILVSLVVPRDELNNIPKMFVHFLSVYVFGMFFSHYNHQIIKWSTRYWPYLSFLTVSLIITTAVTREMYDPLMYIQKMLLCWFFVYWLWRFDEYIPAALGTKTLADYSFGIFFLHYYFLLLIKFVSEQFFPYLLQGSLLNWFIHFGMIITLNIVGITLIKKILGKQSRYIVGC